MTTALMRPSQLPNIASATLPASYERACEAMATCTRIDECKDWADKAAALASYAKQADDKTLQALAVRIQARAVRRCGELLKTFQSPGARTDQPLAGDHGRFTQRAAADAAGMSPHQELQAVRVANLSADEFELAVESDHPPTVTALAERGTEKREPTAPDGFTEATHVIGTLKHFAKFCSEQQPIVVAIAVQPYEVAALTRNLDAIVEWLHIFRLHLEGQ